jgi:hypothetical protein
VISKEGFPFATVIMTASMHDSKFLSILNEEQISTCEVIGDKGYISTGQQMSLFEEAIIKVITPPGINMNIVSDWNNS